MIFTYGENKAMTKRFFRMLAAFVVVALTTSLLAQHGLPAKAQGATWTVSEYGYQSNYPDGMTFTIKATSSAGKIKNALVFWRYSPVASRTRQTGVVNETGDGVTAQWVKKITDAVPQWAGVEYWWQLSDEAGNVFETERQFTEYSDNTRKWTRMESEDIIVFLEDGVPTEVGDASLKAMEEARPMYQKYWPNPLGYKPRAIIYNSYATWAEWAPGAGTAASTGGSTTIVAGQTRDTWGATIQKFNPFDRSNIEQQIINTAYSVVVHEVAHLYQYANGGTRGSLWFVEGNATFFELVGRDSSVAYARELARSGELPTLQGEGPSGRGAFARAAYDIGCAFFVWLDETYGAEAHKLLWASIDQGRSVRESLEMVTGMNFVDMETAFRTWLGAPNPVAPTLIPTPALLFPPTPTYEPTSTPKP
jgi:hypothetical protein